MKAKRVLSLGLILSTIFATCTTSGNGTGKYTPEWYFGWEAVEGGVKITRYLRFAADVIIPPQINGKPVVQIGDGAFRRKRLTRVVIPDSVTGIGNEAFADNRLASITIGNSVTSIGNKAFEYNKLTNVVIPDGVVSIGNYAFAHNELTSITIGNGVISIGAGAFASTGYVRKKGRNELTDVVIPDSVVFIGDSAFARNELTDIVIPNSVTSIGNSAFVHNGLHSVVIPYGVISIGDSAFAGNLLTGVVIPKSVVSVGNRAFANNGLLTDVTMPDSIAVVIDSFLESNNNPFASTPFIQQRTSELKTEKLKNFIFTVPFFNPLGAYSKMELISVIANSNSNPSRDISYYVSDVVFVSRNSVDITFASDDKTVTQTMYMNESLALKAGQKLRVYYSVRLVQILNWTVMGIEYR